MGLRDTDIRTGLCTPGFLIAAGSRELTFAREEGYPVSLVSVAIDGLQGHEPDDDEESSPELRHIGDRIKREAGEGSIVAHVGQGEVAVLLPGLGLEKARQVAENIRRRVMGDQEPADARSGGVAVGVASTSDGPSDFAELLRASHAALELGRAANSNTITSQTE